MGELDAAGEIVTGALIGRAVEPGAGEGHGGHGLCLNCGTALVGVHCHRCGQAGHVHRSLGAIGHEILHGVAHFEGKLWRTLPLLAWRPGELTRRYIRGERARFVSPMALFLFSIFTMFAVFQIVGLQTPTELDTGANAGKVLTEMRAKAVEKRADAIESLNERQPGDPRRARYERRIADADQTIRDIDAVPASLRNGNSGNVNVAVAHTGWAKIDHGLEKWQKNPSLMLYKLQTSVYKFSWLLIPLSVPVLWLLFFWRRDYRLYDHTVFVTYSIAFMSLLFLAITILATLGLPIPLIIAGSLIIPFVHIWRQLQQAYAIGWLSALVRASLLSAAIVYIVAAFLLILVGLGLLG